LVPQTAAIIFLRLSSPSFFNHKLPETAHKKEREDNKMIDLSEKSKEEIYREKKEAELREAKRREGEWKRRMDKERKCMIGGTFLKYFSDALLFENEEWDRIAQAVINTDAFKQTVEAIRKEASNKPNQAENKGRKTEQVKKPTTPQAEKPKDESGAQEQKREQGFMANGQGQDKG